MMTNWVPMVLGMVLGAGVLLCFIGLRRMTNKQLEDDKRKKAKVELRNMADQVVYQTRRTLDESSDKIDESETEEVNAKLDELEKLVQDDDGKPLDLDVIDEAAIQAKVAEVEQSMHGISAKLYEAAAAEMAAQEAEGEAESESSDGDVVDADFEVVDD